MLGDHKVGYAVVTYLGFPFARQCIDSVPKDAPLLVVDNKLNDWPLSKAWNYAVQRMCNEEGCEAVVLCNDDITLRPDTGDLLAYALLEAQFTDERPHQDRKIMLVSAYNTRDLPDVGARWGTGPDYSCFCVTPELLATVGPFDEEIPLYFEDNDSHRRIQLAGFQALSYAPYFHHGSGTTNHSAETKARVKAKYEFSEAYYSRKWGGTPGHELFIQPFSGRPVAGAAT